MGRRVLTIAWVMTAAYYFYQYALRSAPGVMVPQLSDAYGLSALGVASLAGLFYYGYSPFSLVAGVTLDRFGPRKVVPIGALAVGIGALLFASGDTFAAAAGRVLQGMGGAFALIGAIYIITTGFPASRAATLIGATQMFGMAGAAAGQSLVGPAMAAGVSWRTFWLTMGGVGLAIGVVLFAMLPGPTDAKTSEKSGRSPARVLGVVFRNPQSILCGLIAGLLATPTTIFDMIWGVRYLQEGHGLDYASAVLRSSTVPLGWIVGCPMLGFISDRIGRRKPVIAGGGVVLLVALTWILFGSPDVFPPYLVGFVAGVASGAVMVPYTVIKEVNPPEMSGTATGVANFLNFTLSALLAPVFGWMLVHVSDGAASMHLSHYQIAFWPLLVGVVVAVILTSFLVETGPGASAVAVFNQPRSRRVWNGQIRIAPPKVPHH